MSDIDDLIRSVHEGDHEDALKGLAQQLANYYQRLLETGLPQDLCASLLINLQNTCIRVVRLDRDDD